MSLVERREKKCRLAQLRIKPPIPEAEIRQFEEEAGIAIPTDYRDFLLNVANGGTAPCRLVPLKYWGNSYWIDYPKPSMVAEPCIVTPEAEKYGEHWLDKAGVADWSERWDKEEWSPMFGTVAIAEIGCGLFYSMIMTGPLRGRVFSWGDHFLNPPYLCSENSFGDWFENCLDAIIRGEPIHFLDGRIE